MSVDPAEIQHQAALEELKKNLLEAEDKRFRELDELESAKDSEITGHLDAARRREQDWQGRLAAEAAKKEAELEEVLAEHERVKAKHDEELATQEAECNERVAKSQVPCIAGAWALG